MDYESTINKNNLSKEQGDPYLFSLYNSIQAQKELRTLKVLLSILIFLLVFCMLFIAINLKYSKAQGNRLKYPGKLTKLTPRGLKNFVKERSNKTSRNRDLDSLYEDDLELEPPKKEKLKKRLNESLSAITLLFLHTFLTIALYDYGIKHLAIALNPSRLLAKHPFEKKVENKNWLVEKDQEIFRLYTSAKPSSALLKEKAISPVTQKVNFEANSFNDFYAIIVKDPLTLIYRFVENKINKGGNFIESTTKGSTYLVLDHYTPGVTELELYMTSCFITTAFFIFCSYIIFTLINLLGSSTFIKSKFILSNMKPTYRNRLKVGEVLKARGWTIVFEIGALLLLLKFGGPMVFKTIPYVKNPSLIYYVYVKNYQSLSWLIPISTILSGIILVLLRASLFGSNGNLYDILKNKKVIREERWKPRYFYSSYLYDWTILQPDITRSNFDKVTQYKVVLLQKEQVPHFYIGLFGYLFASIGILPLVYFTLPPIALVYLFEKIIDILYQSSKLVTYGLIVRTVDKMIRRIIVRIITSLIFGSLIFITGHDSVSQANFFSIILHKIIG